RLELDACLVLLVQLGRLRPQFIGQRFVQLVGDLREARQAAKGNTHGILSVVRSRWSVARGRSPTLRVGQTCWAARLGESGYGLGLRTTNKYSICRPANAAGRVENRATRSLDVFFGNAQFLFNEVSTSLLSKDRALVQR